MNPETRGIFYDQMFPEGVMRERILAAYGSGLRVTIHAIGDRAIATLLDIYEDVAGEGGACDQRFRIEHVQHLRPGDLGRLVQQKVIASVQPYHAIDDGCWAEGRIGRERALWSFAYRTFLDAGVRMAFGSDWPMSPMDPILGIYAAVTRRTLDGRHPDGWIPSQKIPLEAAIYASTMGGAYAEFAEAEKGSITPGKLADFVVLDRNLFEIPPEQDPECGCVHDHLRWVHRFPEVIANDAEPRLPIGEPGPQQQICHLAKRSCYACRSCADQRENLYGG